MVKQITPERTYSYSRRLDDINVQAYRRDSLYHVITKFSFLSFYSGGLYVMRKTSAVLFITCK